MCSIVSLSQYTQILEKKENPVPNLANKINGKIANVALQENQEVLRDFFL